MFLTCFVGYKYAVLNKLGAAAVTVRPPESSFLSSFFLRLHPLFEVLFNFSRLDPADLAGLGAAVGAGSLQGPLGTEGSGWDAPKVLPAGGAYRPLTLSSGLQNEKGTLSLQGGWEPTEGAEEPSVHAVGRGRLVAGP